MRMDHNMTDTKERLINWLPVLSATELVNNAVSFQAIVVRTWHQFARRHLPLLASVSQWPECLDSSSPEPALFFIPFHARV